MFNLLHIDKLLNSYYWLPTTRYFDNLTLSFSLIRARKEIVFEILHASNFEPSQKLDEPKNVYLEEILARDQYCEHKLKRNLTVPILSYLKITYIFRHVTLPPSMFLSYLRTPVWLIEKSSKVGILSMINASRELSTTPSPKDSVDDFSW